MKQASAGRLSRAADDGIAGCEVTTTLMDRKG